MTCASLLISSWLRRCMFLSWHTCSPAKDYQALCLVLRLSSICILMLSYCFEMSSTQTLSLDAF